MTDRWGSETTWTLYAGDGVTVVANGGPYRPKGAAGSYPQAVETFCLPGVSSPAPTTSWWKMSSVTVCAARTVRAPRPRPTLLVACC